MDSYFIENLIDKDSSHNANCKKLAMMLEQLIHFCDKHADEIISSGTCTERFYIDIIQTHLVNNFFITVEIADFDPNKYREAFFDLRMKIFRDLQKLLMKNLLSLSSFRLGEDLFLKSFSLEEMNSFMCIEGKFGFYNFKEDLKNRKPIIFGGVTDLLYFNNILHHYKCFSECDDDLSLKMYRDSFENIKKKYCKKVKSMSLEVLDKDKVSEEINDLLNYLEDSGEESTEKISEQIDLSNLIIKADLTSDINDTEILFQVYYRQKKIRNSEFSIPRRKDVCKYLLSAKEQLFTHSGKITFTANDKNEDNISYAFSHLHKPIKYILKDKYKIGEKVKFIKSIDEVETGIFEIEFYYSLEIKDDETIYKSK